MENTYAVAAAVDTKVGGCGDGSAEPEDDVESVETDSDHGDIVAVQDCYGEEVE